jgi:TonB family protein
MPQFPGGNKALAQQLTDSIDLLPVKWEELKDDDFNLSIKLSFVIDEQGNVSDVKVLRSMNVINDAKLVSAVKKMKFTPGMQDGKPVKVLYILPFDYVIPPR